MEFDVVNILYYCGMILLSTKMLGMITRRFGLPQVVGMILAGLLIGPAIFGHIGSFPGLVNPSPSEMKVLQSFSQIGVVFILFSSGLETDLGDLKKSGFAATLVALAGVFVPMGLGTAGALLYMGGFGGASDPAKLMNALFVGCILTATSVGITVETMRELGKLNTKVGTTILSAAIIDDVIGIIVLSIVTSLGGDGDILATLLQALGFFIFSIGGGILMRMVFKRMVAKYPHKRRTSIFAIAMCFFFAFAAEKFFGIASITGAYMAGLMLSGLNDTSFVDRKVVVSGYMIFTPMFFAYIGISADFSDFRLSGLVFALIFVVLGILGKIFGCAAAARCVKYKGKDALTIGCGMIARGEVALAVYSTGHSMIATDISGNVVGIDPLVATICLIVCSSVLCPVLLKLMFRNHTDGNTDDREHKVRISSEALENVHSQINRPEPVPGGVSAP